MAQGVSRKESIQAVAVIITFNKVYGGRGEAPNGQKI